jgi:hypothetical protein
MSAIGPNLLYSVLHPPINTTPCSTSAPHSARHRPGAPPSRTAPSSSQDGSSRRPRAPCRWSSVADRWRSGGRARCRVRLENQFDGRPNQGNKLQGKKKQRRYSRIHEADADTERIREAFEREGRIRLQELGVREHTHLADVVPGVWTQEPGGKEVGLFELGYGTGKSSVSHVSSTGIQKSMYVSGICVLGKIDTRRVTHQVLRRTCRNDSRIGS